MHALEGIRSTGTLAPIKKLWDEFCAYTYLEDDIFTQECIVLVVILYKDQVVTFLPGESAERFSDFLSKRLAQYIMHPDEKVDLPVLQEENETIVHKGHAVCEGVHCSDVGNHVDAMARLLTHASLEDMTTKSSVRFYYLNRLSKAMAVAGAKQHGDCFFSLRGAAHYFKHPRIQKIFVDEGGCIHGKSFLRLWKSIEAYDLIDDVDFIDEFLRLTLLLYINAVVHKKHTNGVEDISTAARIKASDIATLYATLAALPIREMLLVLDEMVDLYEGASQQYEMSNSALSWRDWFKKYYWTLPVSALSIAALVLKNHEIINTVWQRIFPLKG
jgi:hypothetical protein